MSQNVTEIISTTMGALESSIISAHKKYFGGNPEVHGQLKDHEQAILYNTVIKYFTGNS